MKIGLRQMRGLAIVAAGGQIRRLNDHHFVVRSQTSNRQYEVFWKTTAWSCNCQDFYETMKPCKHVYATVYLIGLPNIVLANSNALQRSCPNCGSNHIVRNGSRKNKGGMVQTYACVGCGKKFRAGLARGANGSNAMLMLLALDLFYKGVSLRDIRNHIWQIYNVEKAVSTLHSWVIRLTRIAVKVANNLTPEVGGRWLGDEMVVKVNGKRNYLWNILDYETRHHIVSMVAEGRGENEAYGALLRAIRTTGKTPHEFVTDGLASYPKAVGRMKREGIRIFHTANVGIAEKANNNRIERRHGGIRAWARPRRGLKGNAQVTIDGNVAYYNHIRPHLALGDKPPSPLSPDNKWSSLLEKSQPEN